MSDIVERLRTEKYHTLDARLPLLREAADEIERLRKALEPFAWAYHQAEPHRFISLHQLRMAGEALDD